MSNRNDLGGTSRPYIVCHMLTAVDGKITGPFMKTPEARIINEEYERTNETYHPQAWMCGRVTMDDYFTLGHKPELEENVSVYPRTDYVANPNAEMYIVSVDPSGRLGWTQNYVDYLSRPRAHIIEVLTGKVSDAYIAYLRKYGISYIFAGEDSLNCALAAEKLKSLFGIKVLMLSGGGFLNWSFLQEGLIDELSIVMAPLTDGETNTVTLFEKADYLPPKAPVAFSLESVEPVNGDGVWLRYTVKK
ncbi:RibD family protein [Metabacillus arenae]|uniref:RibD family protein n=1 Tax=Metabacillus arenae TaxID=2771434 RepID=A0A926S0C8_9BACI|nr:RibD family protein [Metabacillus arenae]MBD1379879.1 RibD family protein [Metabacillus arenae]